MDYSFLDIATASSDAEVLSTWRILAQLRPHLAEHEYVQHIRALQAGGYRILAISSGGRVVGVAGFRIAVNLAWGRHLYLDDLVVEEGRRSQKFGHALMTRTLHIASTEGCAQVHLDCGVQRFDAHRFYMREGFSLSSHHFKRGSS